MTKLEQAARQALEALHAELEAGTCEEFENAAEKCYEALTALREALAEQAEQEPVAWRCVIPRRTWSLGIDWGREYFEREEDIRGLQGVEPLYAAPVSIAKQSETDSSSSLMRTTVRTKDLTKTEMLTEAVEAGFMLHTGYGQGTNKMMPVSDSATLIEFARAVIAADREKNRG